MKVLNRVVLGATVVLACVIAAYAVWMGFSTHAVSITFVNTSISGNTIHTTHTVATVTGNKANGFRRGEVVTLQVTTTPGFEFVRWRGDIASTNNTIQFTVKGKTNLTLEYSMTPFDIYFFDGADEIEKLENIRFGAAIATPDMDAVNSADSTLFAGFRGSNNSLPAANLNVAMINLATAIPGGTSVITYDAAWAEAMLNFNDEFFDIEAGDLAWLTGQFVDGLNEKVGDHFPVGPNLFERVTPDGHNANPGYTFGGWEFKGEEITDDTIFTLDNFTMKLDGTDWVAEIMFSAIWEANQAGIFFWLNKAVDFETGMYLNGTRNMFTVDVDFETGIPMSQVITQAHSVVGPMPSTKLQVAIDSTNFANPSLRLTVEGWLAVIGGQIHIFAVGNNQVNTPNNRNILLQWADIWYDVSGMVNGGVISQSDVTAFSIRSEFVNNFHHMDSYNMIIMNNELTGETEDIHFFAIFSNNPSL
ncbi:MAG: hypothetical protein FWD89_03745 [Firmicutes bacterium]|nr:hypothetical protein [Bacillota bacterium]